MRERRTVLSAFNIRCFVWICLLVTTSALDNRTLIAKEVEYDTHDGEISIDMLHSKGVDAYLNNDWDGCVKYLTTAVKEHRIFVKGTTKCRTRCKSESNEKPHMFPTDIENLHFYETALRTTLCLLRCKNSIFKNKFVSITPELDKLYWRMKPYEYLHLCYYQKKLFQEAASACFTSLIANPNNEVMAKNFKFYSSLPEVNTFKIENMETKKFVPLYIKGVDAYNNGDFTSTILLLEKSLKEWLIAADECRAYCEAPFDQGWLPDFISSVANHFTFCLRCKQKCETSLNSLNGENHDDILPSHYHYLQFSYYKVGKLQKACEAVESYLLFFPDEETMIDNKKFYLNYLDGNAEFFVPRKEALKYIKRQQYENKIAEYIDTEFKKLDENAVDDDTENDSTHTDANS